MAACSTNVNRTTLINTAPGTYDVNVTGDPTYSANVIFQNTHRNWVTIKNDHGTATSVLKLTGKSELRNATIDCGSGSNDGVIFSGSGANGSRMVNCYLECESVTGAHTAITLEGGIEYVRFNDVMIHGVVANTTALLLNNCALSKFVEVDIHDCLTGLQITNAGSDQNIFNVMALSDCTIGIDIDAGNNQLFDDITFTTCSTHVDDEVGDSTWRRIYGCFAVTLNPETLAGINVVAHNDPDTWGNDTEIVAAGAIDSPFKIVGYVFVPVVNQNHVIRFSSDSGSTFFETRMINNAKSVGTGASAGTEYIFNKGTRISASVKAATGGEDAVATWLILQIV